MVSGMEGDTAGQPCSEGLSEDLLPLTWLAASMLSLISGLRKLLGEAVCISSGSGRARHVGMRSSGRVRPAIHIWILPCLASKESSSPVCSSCGYHRPAENHSLAFLRPKCSCKDSLQRGYFVVVVLLNQVSLIQS